MKRSPLKDALRYTLLIACLCGLAARASVRVDLIGSNSPMPGQVAPGSTVTLKVRAIGQGANPSWEVAWGETDLTKATFQWFRAGVAIPAATASTLVLPNVSLADAGNYSVRVTSSVPSVDWGIIAVNVVGTPAGEFVDTSFTVPEASNEADIYLVNTRADSIAAVLADGSVVVRGQSLGDRTGWKVFGPNGARLGGWTLDTVHYPTSVRIWPDGTVVFLPSSGSSAPTIFAIDGRAPSLLPAGFSYDKITAMLIDGDRALVAQDRRLVRLDAARALDPNFTAVLPAATATVIDVKRDLAGNYLVIVSDDAKRSTLVRLNLNGAVDPGFTPFVFPSGTDNPQPAPQVDGSILFSITPNGAQTTQIVRLLADGTRDQDFNGIVPAGFIRVDSHGRCYGIENGRLWRYFADGDLEIDPSFHPGAPDDPYFSINLDSQDRVIAVGAFKSWSGHATVNVARLLPVEGQNPLLPAVWLRWESTGATSASAYTHVGARIAIRAIVAGNGPYSYDWIALDGGKLPSSTHDRELVFDAFSAENFGRYQLRVTSPAGVSLSEVVDLSATSLPPVSLVNLSGRATVGTGENAPIAGFVTNTTLTGNRSFLLRGAGPALKPYGVTDTATDPVLSVYDARGTMTNEADNWNEVAEIEFAIVGAFPFTAGSADAALSNLWPGGAHTLRLTDKQPHDGVGMIEIYDRWASSEYFPGQLVNLSLRAQVGIGDKIAIGGFVIVDTTGFGRSLKMLIRGVGPTLSTLGIQQPLANPKLSLFNSKGKLLRSNDNWADNTDATAIAAAMKQVGAFDLPANSKDAALLVDLPAGAYTAHVSGADNTTGVALLEIYVVR